LQDLEVGDFSTWEC